MAYADQFPPDYHEQFPVDADSTIPVRDSLKSSAPSDATAAGIRAKGPVEPLLKWGLDALPTAGGLVGGTAGGIGGTVFGAGVGGVPGAISGSTAGGLGGEALRQLGYHAFGYGGPQTPQEAIGAIAREGVMQGLQEMGGRAVAGTVGAAARPLMKRALRPSLKAAERGVVETALREKIPVGKLPWERAGGSQKLQRILSEATAAAERERAASSAMFTGRDVQPEIDALIAEVGKGSQGATRAKQVRALAKRFYKDKGRPMTAEQFNDLKRASQSEASSIYEAGPHSKADPALARKFSKAVASGARRALEDRIPRVAAPNARASKLMSLERTLAKAEHVPGSLAIPMLPRSIGDIALPGAAELQSRAALMANDPRLLFLLGQLPRVAGRVLLPPLEFNPPAPPDSTR